MTGNGWISGSIFVLINCLFLYKYGSRVTPFAGVASIVYAAAWWVLLRLRHRLPSGNVLPAVSMIWVAVFTLAVHFVVPIASLNVDRWSVIASFLDNLYAGEYP